MRTKDDGSLTLRAWAKSRGVPIATAHKAVKTGRITRRTDGRLDAAQVDREWGAAAHRGRISPTRTLIEAQRRLVTAKASRERLRLRQERGELVSAKEVQAYLFKVARRSRDRVLLSPNRLAVALGPLTAPADILAALEAEARAVCTDMVAMHTPGAPPRLAGNADNEGDASVESEA